MDFLKVLFFKKVYTYVISILYLNSPADSLLATKRCVALIFAILSCSIYFSSDFLKLFLNFMNVFLESVTAEVVPTFHFLPLS